MRMPSWWRPASCGQSKSTASCLAVISLATAAQALTFNEVSDPNLDISQLGRIGIGGNFTGISFYEYDEQTEEPYDLNGPGSLISRLPNGLYTNLFDTDASIRTMCALGDVIILGGNFTSVNETESQAVAQYDLNTNALTPLAGVTGQVNSLLCDEDEGLVYVGGSFRAADSANAITWAADGSWQSLPFAGFNGPVNSITKGSDGNIIFGGRFTGLGNTSTPTTLDAQMINIENAEIQTYQGSKEQGFSDPKNIICNTDGTDGPGSTWLVEDGLPGEWQPSFGFFFVPTKLRLYNTHFEGRGTKTWEYWAFPNNGIMNFTYVDPDTGDKAHCTDTCPLSNDPSIEYQDFHFVNPINMNGFKIQISDWYGAGAGLNGVQLFGNGIFTYAIDGFNEPSCSNTTTPSKSQSTGPWKQTGVSESATQSSEYLAANLSTPITSDAASVTFYPDIKEDGEYNLKLFTPGCLRDDTCAQRGQVQAKGKLTKDGKEEDLFKVFQTNNFDKFDMIPRNFSAATDSFRPSITLTPVAGQSLPDGGSTMVMVAQSLSYETLRTTARGLNGLFEYDPANPSIKKADLESSAFVKLGNSLATDADVNSLVMSNDLTFIGGSFSSNNVHNIAAIDNNDSVNRLAQGLNGAVLSILASDDNTIIAAGQFDATQDGTISDLNHVAAYDISAGDWSALGAGVDGTVHMVVSMQIDIDGNEEDVVALSGNFENLLSFDGNEAVQVQSFAIWVPSQNNWLQNLDSPIPLIAGMVTSSLLDSSKDISLYGGALTAESLSANGVATMSDSLGSFPINLLRSTGATSNQAAKRNVLVDQPRLVDGVTTGLFNTDNGRNLTILAGHFAADATDSSILYNLAFIDGKDSDTVSGLGDGIDRDSIFLSVAAQDDVLFAGGQVTGSIDDNEVNGLVAYDLNSKAFGTQPPALDGSSVIVTAVDFKPKTTELYVGGTFDSAGSLPCPGVCLLSVETNQWSRPGFGLEGNVNAMMWISNDELLVVGDLSVNNTATYIAMFDAKAGSWSGYPDADSLPGPVDLVTIADTIADDNTAKLWVAGADSDGKPFVMKYDGKAWKSAALDIGDNSSISSLQVFTVTKDHDETDIMPADQVLMLTGSIRLPGFGTASSVIFDGTNITPFALTSNVDSTTGSIWKIFVEHEDGFLTAETPHKMPLGFVVLIALAISLGLMLLIVVAGVLLDRYRKKREGYVPAPTSMYDRGSGMQRIPPHELLDSLNKGRPGAPQI